MCRPPVVYLPAPDGGALLKFGAQDGALAINVLRQKGLT